MDIGFPHAVTLIKVTRKSTSLKNKENHNTSFYISSCTIDKYTVEQWMSHIRGHWGGVEILNHWRKDACLLEDKTRSRNANIVGTFAMIRNLLFYYYEQQEEHATLPGYVEAIAANSNRPLSMIRGIL